MCIDDSIRLSRSIEYCRNRCWCGSPTDYDPYGAGICTAACAGDDSIVCGGSYLFSLYLIIGDGGFPVVTDGADDDATPSPTPAPVQSGTDDNDDQGDDDGGTGGDEGETQVIKIEKKPTGQGFNQTMPLLERSPRFPD